MKLQLRATSMLVRSFDRFDTVGDFDPESGRLVELERSTGMPTTGGYTYFGTTLAVFYRVSPTSQ